MKTSIILAMLALLTVSALAAPASTIFSTNMKPMSTTNIPGTLIKLTAYSQPTVVWEDLDGDGISTKRSTFIESLSWYNAGRALPKNTQYTIVYGVGSVAAVKAAATCVAGFNSGTSGYVSGSTLKNEVVDATPYSSIKNNGVNNRFLIVPTAGVDCNTGIVTANNKNILNAQVLV